MFAADLWIIWDGLRPETMYQLNGSVRRQTKAMAPILLRLSAVRPRNSATEKNLYLQFWIEQKSQMLLWVPVSWARGCHFPPVVGGELGQR